MSERNSIELPGSSGTIDPKTWSVDKEDLPLMRMLLEMSGLDLSAPDIDKALATARPVPLPEEMVATLSPAEQEEYRREQAYYERSGWSLPHPTELQKQIYGL